jgi:hypothetical protein
MQPVDDPARYLHNPNPKWEVSNDKSTAFSWQLELPLTACLVGVELALWLLL